jgi:hypothetical protein
MFHVFLLPLIVFGDMCQDFCTESLGRETCQKGSYCKKNYDCHNLFWTSEERGQICVFTGRGECTNRYPVLCSEADTSRTRPRVPTTTTMPTSQPGFLSRMFTRFFAPTRATQSAQQQLGVNVIALELHFHSTTHLRVHPYIKLSFQNEGRNLGYNALFDTGTDKTYIFAESAFNPFNEAHVSYEPAFRLRPGDPISRPAGVSEGYRLRPGVTPRNSETLVYGVDGYQRRFESLGSIVETITVFSDGSNQFTFHAPQVNLIPPPGDWCRAILGARPGSAFGTAAGVFAVVPSPPYPLPNSNWQLLVGTNSTHHAQGYCSAEDPTLRWYPRVSPVSWIIDGVMSLARSGLDHRIQEPHVVQNIEMFLDTGGTDGIHLTPRMMDFVISELESFGPRRIPSDGRYPRFTNCSHGLPLAALSLRLGIQPRSRNPTMDPLVSLLMDHLEFDHYRIDETPTMDPLFVEFPISNHLRFDQVGECTLKWEVGTLGAPNRVLVGTAFLGKVVTVFDNLNRQVGMCRRGQNPIQH